VGGLKRHWITGYKTFPRGVGGGGKGGGKTRRIYFEKNFSSKKRQESHGRKKKKKAPGQQQSLRVFSERPQTMTRKTPGGACSSPRNRKNNQKAHKWKKKKLPRVIAPPEGSDWVGGGVETGRSKKKKGEGNSGKPQKVRNGPKNHSKRFLHSTHRLPYATTSRCCIEGGNGGKTAHAAGGEQQKVPKKPPGGWRTREARAEIAAQPTHHGGKSGG